MAREEVVEERTFLDRLRELLQPLLLPTIQMIARFLMAFAMYKLNHAAGTGSCSIL
jgi:hypothetical protein